MKASNSVDDFLNITRYILAINEQITEIPQNECIPLFQFSQSGTYDKFITDANKRKIHCNLSKGCYGNLVKNACVYCKNGEINGAQGIDRIDSSIGYILENVASCCKTCNYMKTTMSKLEFFSQLKSIYNFRILHIKNATISISERIMSLCTNVKPFNHEKFFHSKKYYDDLIFGNDGLILGPNIALEQIKSAKIHLEFVEDKKQMDIWNYFRRNVSSLKKDHSKLIGRQIHILVKDLTSEKYLGIMSLSSDVYNLEKRDRLIGWNYTDKANTLKHIMNITTCVPLQPFGYNFNGGKLITSLAFSEEIMTYFKTKYKDDLLAITTTSLYGKSIQYDRLPCLKFIGYTKGNSVMNIPSEVTSICANYLKREYNLNYPPRKKFIIIQKAFDKLNISKEDFLQSNPKGIYFGYTCSNARGILCGTPLGEKESLMYNKNVKPAKEISEWWINRWAIQRFSNLIEKNNIQYPT